MKYNKQSELIKKILGIDKILSVRFSNFKNKNYQRFEDTVCTAMIRSLKNNQSVYLDRKLGQLCPGGNYFLNIKKLSKQKVCNVYVDDEQVFANNKVCAVFLKNLPKYPPHAKKHYILFAPMAKEKHRPDTVIILANPAQVSRLLGLSFFKQKPTIDLVPAGPTCLSLYVPLISKQIHLNFIDYYDRYYQGKQGKKLMFKDEEMIISMPYKNFVEILKIIHLSPNGLFKPRLKPQKVTPLG